MIKTINEISMFVDGKNLINPLIISGIKPLVENAIKTLDLESVMDELCRYRSLFFAFKSPKSRRKITSDEFDKEAKEQELSLNIERVKTSSKKLIDYL